MHPLVPLHLVLERREMSVPPSSLITIWLLRGILYPIKVPLNHAGIAVHMQCLEDLKCLGVANDGLPISPWKGAVDVAQVVLRHGPIHREGLAGMDL